MAYILSDRAIRLLVRLDRQYGIAATYKVPSGTTLDPVTGDIVRLYVDTDIVIRSSGLSTIELSQISASNLGHIDARWVMQHAYVDNVRAGHIIAVSSFFYEIIDAALDDLQLLWTVLTRRRR